MNQGNLGIAYAQDTIHLLPRAGAHAWEAPSNKKEIVPGSVMNPVLAEDRALAASLFVLSNPLRLAILRELRTPKVLRELRIPSGEASNSEVPLSRQAVRQHLDRLLEIEAITALPGERAFGETMEYVLDHRTLFEISENFRNLAALRPAREPSPRTTIPSAAPSAKGAMTGPRLALVRGLREGTVFPLHDGNSADGAWILGKARNHAVVLDYDPYVSTDNAIVRTNGTGRFTIEDVPGSRNGTSVNFQQLRTLHALRHGDVVGVGRSLLVFWER